MKISNHFLNWMPVLVALATLDCQILTPLGAAIVPVINSNDHGTGSLRQAILNAGNGDTISLAVTGVITLTSGELLIAKNLAINGPGATNLAVSGNLSNRIFEISSNVTASISGLTIRDGHASDGTNFSLSPDNAGRHGGGILNAGTLALTACNFITNLAGNGGASTTLAGAGGNGGGIHNSGTLAVTACSFAGNAAGAGGTGSGTGYTSGSGGPGGSGGGIYNSGSLRLTSCIFQENRGGNGGSGASSRAGIGAGAGGGGGGGVYNTGTLSLSGCSIIGNAAGHGGAGSGSPPGGLGGGICNAGTLGVADCAISSNFGGTGGNGTRLGGFGGGGGGIYNSGALALTNCTLSGNAAGSGGGGIYQPYFRYYGWDGSGGNGGAIFSSGTFTIIASTIGGNAAGTGGPGANVTSGAGGTAGGNGGSGGGIMTGASASSANLRSAMVAMNVPGIGGPGGSGTTTNGTPGMPGSSPDLAGAFSSQGHNLIGQTDGSSGLSNGFNSDLTGTTASPLDPKLGPLARNGGPTFTMALLPVSPALDAGDDALLAAPFNLTTDQRGLPRKSGAHMDIGAFELQSVVLAGTKKLGNGAFQFGFAGTPGASFTVLFATSIGLPESNWTVLGAATEIAPGQFQFTDAQAMNSAHRFYCVKSP